MAWYTETQLEQATRDLYDHEAAEAEACDMGDWPSFDARGPETRDAFRVRAQARLGAMTPIDLTRDLKLRNGAKVYGAKVSEDGFYVIAEFDGIPSRWQIDGRITYGRTDNADLIYAR